MSLTLNNVVIESRVDKYINATQLCKAGGKRFSDWYCMKSTKELIDVLHKTMQKSVSQKIMLVDIKRGNSSTFSQGSWIHPDLAVQLAQWVDPTFSIHVSKWIGEWRLYSRENEDRFQQALSEIQPSESVKIESQIRDELLKELGGTAEVTTPAGFIDLLTEEKLIEVKVGNNWKHALGQALSYSIYYPDKKKYIYLFGEVENKAVIERTCETYGVKVVYIHSSCVNS